MKTDDTTHKHNVAGFFSHNVQYWEEVYAHGDPHAREFPGYAKNRRKSLVFGYLDAYARQRTLAVLDIGCGPGVYMEETLRRGHAVTGIDISETMVGKAHERLEKYGHGKFTCRQGDVENIPAGDESMDVVFCLGVLPYLRDDRKAVEEIRRVLKKGGMGIVVLPNIFKLGNLLDPYYYLVRSWQYLWYGHLRRNVPPQKTLDPVRFNENKEFGVRRYTLGQAVGSFGRCITIPEENVTVIEYGPLTFLRREILSDRLSIRLSEFLVRRSIHWGGLKHFANEWVMYFVKPA